MLRDDPTASVELRLQALAPEELPLDALLAELRRHDRIPMELAAGMHELAAAAARAESGAAPEPRDAGNAVSVAEALDAHLRGRTARTLDDPLLNHEAEVPLTSDEPGETSGRDVPPADSSLPWRWLLWAGALAALVILVVWLAGRGGGSAIRRADSLVEEGRTATAASALRGEAGDPRAAVRLARLYREAGRPLDALRAIRDGMVAAPGDPRLNEELGLLLLDEDRPQDAVRAFSAALRADSTSERAWVGLARSLSTGGDTAAAGRVLRAAPEAARTFAGTPPPASPAPVSSPAP